MNNIDVYGILNSKVYYNLSVKELYKITIHKKQGILTNNGFIGFLTNTAISMPCIDSAISCTENGFTVVLAPLQRISIP